MYARVVALLNLQPNTCNSPLVAHVNAYKMQLSLLRKHPKNKLSRVKLPKRQYIVVFLYVFSLFAGHRRHLFDTVYKLSRVEQQFQRLRQVRWCGILSQRFHLPPPRVPCICTWGIIVWSRSGVWTIKIRTEWKTGRQVSYGVRAQINKKKYLGTKHKKKTWAQTDKKSLAQKKIPPLFSPFYIYTLRRMVGKSKAPRYSLLVFSSPNNNHIMPTFLIERHLYTWSSVGIVWGYKQMGMYVSKQAWRVVY